MFFSHPSLHARVISTPEHKDAVRAAMPPVLLAQQAREATAPTSQDWIEFPLTTVSVNSSFDAKIIVNFQGAPDGSGAQMIVDSGNSTLIMPRFEDLSNLANYATDYQDLGDTKEPWGCPAKVIKGPITFRTTSGDTYTIPNCVFFACTADKPSDPPRTANFGTGCLNPWTASSPPAADGSTVLMQAPFSYDPAYPYLEFNFAPADDVQGAGNTPTTAGGSVLRIYKAQPEGYQVFDILPGIAWMSLTPKSLNIAGVQTAWPGALPSPIAMIDTGGGPVFLSDPNSVIDPTTWPDTVPNPSWASNSVQCTSTKDALTIAIGDGSGTFTYTVDTSGLPAPVQGLTLVACQQNSFMMGQNGMNIGGISALSNLILIDYANNKVGFKPK